MITVNPDLCPQDHPCPMIPRCPQEAISQAGVGLPVVDNEGKMIGIVTRTDSMHYFYDLLPE